MLIKIKIESHVSYAYKPAKKKYWKALNIMAVMVRAWLAESNFPHNTFC